eukprot:scaffold1640_cov37-Tisochrysis_lutea.AAC.3
MPKYEKTRIGEAGLQSLGDGTYIETDAPGGADALASTFPLALSTSYITLSTGAPPEDKGREGSTTVLLRKERTLYECRIRSDDSSCVGPDAHAAHVAGRYVLDPYGLPDSGGGCVRIATGAGDG